MNLSVGIVGLANVGKSTLFNALLKKQVAVSANYPFTTIEPNVGVVEVPDSRLQKLAEVIANENSGQALRLRSGRARMTDKVDSIASLQNDKSGWPPIVPAVVKFVDIAGLVRGAHKGEGLGNQFLAHIREVDVIVFVLRDFKNEDIIKTGENPKEDLEVLRDELLLKDLETIDKKLETLNKETKNLTQNDPRYAQVELASRAQTLIQQGRWIADEFSVEDLSKISDLQLLSAKKTIVVLNSDEDALSTGVILGSETTPESKKGFWTSQNDMIIRICAKLEEELAGLEEDEQKQYLKELGIEESGLERLIKCAYETLGLATFLTAGPKEVRAWTIKSGFLAPQAAGVIHSDFERGFIAADVVSFDKFIEAGGWQRAREKGLVKTIGKNEVIPGDMVVEFKFSV